MTKHFKRLILLLCILSIISSCTLPTLADETLAQADTTLSPENETTAEADTTLSPENETTVEADTTTTPADDTTTAPEITDETTDVPSTPYAVSFTVTAGESAKIEYAAGEYFSAESFIGTLTMSDGSSIPVDTLTYLQTDALTAENAFITFVYGSLTYDFPITVLNQPYVVDVEFSLPKTEFLALETIDPATVVANLIYSDGSKAPLDLSLCTVYPSLEEPVSAYTQSYTLTYTDGSSSFSSSVAVAVSPIILLEVTGIENAKLYESTPNFIPAGMTVTAYYDGAKTISQVLTDFTVNSDTVLVTADSNGKTKITIVADSASLEVELDVNLIVNYTVSGYRSKYYYGDVFDPTTVKVVAFYSDYTSYDVSDQVVFMAPEIITSGSTITAIHNGFDLKDFLAITLPVGTLDIIAPPTKLHYEIGEVFDSTGLVVGINYSDGVRRPLNAGDYEIIVSNPLTSADKIVSIRYHGASTSVSISVGDEAYIVSLNLAGVPDVLKYFEGSLLNTSGIIIEAYMSDGTKVIVDPMILTFTPALTTPLTSDITFVTISANDGTDKFCKVTFPITVEKKAPTALVATSKPNKLEYTEGQTFNPDGLELSLIFNDGTSIVPSSITFSPDLNTSFVLYSNKAQKHIIYAVCEYDGVEFTYPIEVTVRPAEIQSLVISRNPIKTEYKVGEEFIPMGIEILLIYKDRTLTAQVIPEEQFSYSPKVITGDTKEIVFSFRGTSVALPITVIGAATSEDTTATVTPPDTTAPPSSDDVTTETTDDVTSTETDTTTDPEVTPDVPDVTSSPNDITTEDITVGSESTTEDTTGTGDKNPSSLLYLWIIVIVIIIASLIALIIYYKKNFT